MIKKPSLTIHLGNYNGLRNPIDGKGRLEITIESLLNSCPGIENFEFRIIDNFSEDGSWDYLKTLKFPLIERKERLVEKIPWLSTTMNNLNNLRGTIEQSSSEYIWNIENDSFFYGDGSFIQKAVRVLDENDDISLVHLKRWVNLDLFDSPGVPINMNRFDEVRQTKSGDKFYLLEQRNDYSLWIPIGKDKVGNLDSSSGIGMCPFGDDKIGSIKKFSSGFQRILTEHWNSYTSHGWIGKRKDLLNLLNKYSPIGERQMSMAFKEEGLRSAKLDIDAFVDFGWKSRVKPSEEQIKKVFEDVIRNKDISSISLFGYYRPNFLKAPVEFNGKLDVYN